MSALAIIPRSEWGAPATAPDWKPQYRPIDAIIIHHEGVVVQSPWPDAVTTIWRYHAQTLGWGDIGYNFLIDPQGRVYEGRAGGAGVVGGHALQYNWGSIGVCLLGNYEIETPTDAMTGALAAFLREQCVRHGLDPLGRRPFHGKMLPIVMGHRDCQATACPGENVYRQLAEIRAQVATV